MQNPIDIINRFRKIIKELRERNETLSDDLRQACRGEAVYKESLTEEIQRNYELTKTNRYLNERIDLMQERHREQERMFHKRLWQAHNPHLQWQDFKTDDS